MNWPRLLSFKVFILIATTFAVTTQASFLINYITKPYVYIKSKQGRTKRSKALVKIFTDLLVSHGIPCKGNQYDTVHELKKKLCSSKITLYDEISIIIDILSNNIYQRSYNIAFSQYKKTSATPNKDAIDAFAQKEKCRFLTIINQPRSWEPHEIAGLGLYCYPFYFLPREEDLESLFFFFSDNQIQKRWVDAQK